MAAALRLRLLEPSVGVVSGGTRIVLHGAGFRPPPHSLTVRLRVDLQDADNDNHSDTCDPLSWTTRQPISNTVDINGRFLLDTQLECVLPSFERQAARAIAARTCLAASSASVSSAPQLVPLSVEVILNGGEQRSNTLSFKLHQPLEVRRICPQSVLMVSPAVTATVTLNILKLSAPVVHKATPKGGHLEVLEDLSTLPVFVRVKQASERTGAVSEQTREGKWKLSPLGVYEVEFDAPTMGFGAVSVELSLNRVEFFRCKSDAPPEGFGYRVLRDVTLRAVEPACISVTSGQITEIKVVGDGFVDTGDLVVAMLQKELPSAEGDGVKPAKDVQVAVLNATYFGKTEVRCTVPANLPFGCTTFSVSLNGGRQFGQSRVVGLLHRDRALEGISPASSSLAGGTTVTIRHSCLCLEHVDALYQLQRLEPPRRIRVRFQPVSYSGSESGGGLAKVANAEAFSQTPGLLICKTPNFLENIKALNGMRAAGASESDGDNVPYMWRFTVAVAVGGEAFHGELPFSLYLPPVIRSLTQHHGPSTGDTSLKLRMKHKVPPRIKLLVRFSTLDFTKSKTIEGHPSPQWIETLAGSTREVPHLTIVQVSYDAGVTFFPVIDTPPTAVQSNPLAKDLSYLCFLFYPPPVVRSAVPLSVDILGGSYVRLQGEHLVDHGAQMSVIFESSALSRKVSAFVEKGELRCCAPPFNVGRARVFVSLNDEQYTLCDLHDQETNAPVEFIFYSSPTVTRISPLCACVRLSSELKIYGTNLIETDRIKVRVSFPASSGRRPLFKDVPGTARDGVITATTPVFPDEYANQNALVDVALNGANLSGTSVPLRYFSNYGITRVDPPLGAFEVPVTLTVFIAPAIVTDKILVRLRLGVIEAVAGEHESSKEESEVVHGLIDASSWTASSVELMAPSLSTLVESLSALTTAHLEVSFDGVRFHGVGNLRDHYRVYNVPQLTSANPLFGLSDRETRIVAHGVHMRPDDVVKLTLFLESTGADRSKGKDRRVAARTAPVPVTTVVAEINVKRQRLSFTCPSLAQLRASPDRQHAPIVAPSPGITNGVPDRRSQGGVDGGMLLSERVIMQISVIDGQPISLPFVFRYYRSPTLVAMNPRVGYVCSGSIVSFEFAERIATPTVDFRFGDSLPTSGRIRDERFVECFSPELSAGTHSVSISFNEQHYEPAVLKEHKGEPTEENELSAATFHAFPLPVFVLPPAGRDRVYAFGPTSGGTVVVIKGKGFVPDTKIYARFASQFKDAFDGQSEIIVGAKVVDDETIRCISPPSMRLGRAVLHVSYNLQQFSDSTCYFEYHAPTRYVARGTLCGPISGHTPLELAVEDVKGLPSHTQLLQCVVRFESEKSHTAVDVEAQFDAEMCVLSCTSPAWPSNELVNLRVSLSRGDGELFEDTRIKFLFYDPPEGVIKIEPAAGPIGGGTEVLAWCGSIVETGEITVSIQLSRSELERPRLTKRRSSTSVAPPLSRKSSLRCNQTLPPLLVKGEIVGESIRFIAPPVDGPCTAVLGISLNGISYTSTQSPLHFTYYVEPTLRRISPGWAALEGASDALVIEGEHIRDFGCNLLVRFSLQDEMQPEQNGIVVGAQFISNSTASASGDGALRCGFPAAPPGFYEHEISLNGQQFSQSQYVSKTFGNLSGTACTALLPFRHFSSPFCLATATGPAAGGSSVVLFLGGKLLKVLSRETKCQVQFTPIKGTEKITRLPLTTPNGGASPIKLSSNVADIMCMLGDIDHVNARVTCRAPLLRVACVSNVDILLPSGSGASSACQLFAIRPSDREKYYSYESPSITEIAPSCGPVSGGTQLVIEGAHILDTAQIFVRFRSSLNERECVLVPARYSRTFPGGSASASPLIICNTPPVEFMDKTISSGNDSAAQSTSLLPQPSPRNREGVAAGKARTQTYQMLAEQSLKAHRASAAHGNSDSGLGALRITRPSVRATPRGHSDAESGATVLVDFTLNAGEQFIAHSVRFHYYQDIEPRQVKWSPRHLPTQCLGGRQATDSRMLTVVLPKTFRLTDSPERVCFRFDGANPQVSMRRKSSVLLHETESRTELVIANPSKRQSTMRRSITYFQNSILSSDNIPTSPPVSTRSDSIGTAVSSRRQAVGAPGMKRRPVTPELSSPRPSTTGSSPCIAGKVISASEVTCVVPDFSTPGAVYIFFSPNAQQFVCLGELLFHPAMIIKDEHHHTTFRFCSNVGGSPFALQCSPSTVLRFLAPEDVTTAAKRNAQIRELALRKNSPFGGWQKRSFHSARVFLIPANAKLLKRVTVTATRVDNQSEAGKMGPDGAGCCVFDMSNWGEQVLLSAALPSSCGYASYSSVVALSTLLDPSVIIDSACEVCYVCVRFGAIGCETLGTFDQEEANVQVLVSDSNGVQLCLCGPPVESSIWIRASTVSSQTYTVPITFDFTSADSSRSISASSRARLVLSGFDTFQTSLAISLSPQVANGPTVTLECAMPSLSFSGIATLVISCGGVVFSNSVTVHCYDPRSWKVTALRPPCGQLLSLDDPKKPPEPMTLRLKGEHFVENRKITIRVSDKDRYFTAAGKVDQVHVLSLRIAAVKNLRVLLHPLGIVPHASKTANETSSSQRKEDKYLSSIVGGTTSGGSIVALVSSWSTFTFTIRIECGDQRHFASCRENSVFAAISSGSVLSWEEEFELRVAADRHAPLLLTAELSEPSLPKPLELAQAWIPLNGIQVGSSDIRRYTARFEEHLKRGNYVGSDATPGVATEVELLLQLSPLMLHPDYIVSQIPYSLLQQLSPQALDVQVSSGDGFYSTPHSFLVYNPPTVTHTTPSVLPRSAGGDVVVTGSGFVNSGRVCVRLFAFKKNRFTNSNEEQRALATINRVKRAESTNDGFFPYFSRDVAGTFISTTSLKFRMPSYLTSYNVYYSVSFDGRSFTEASSVSNVLLFSINAVTPKGGPISGNTYATLHGTNIDACLSSRSGLSPLVRVTWKRGARDLEHVMVPGEFYPHEDAVYFYSPQSKFGLYSIAVSVELALLSSGTTAVDTVPRFGRDEVSFVMYKTPTIKSVAPLSALVSGLSTTEIIVQGFDEKAVSNMRLAPKLRFKRRGQMQVSDAQLVSESRFECIVPRFNVANAVATELPLSALSSVRPIQRPRAGGAWSPRRVTSQPKLWTRAAGIFVALLGARNLRASKKNACNPFAVIYVGKMQLKSTRKDGVFSPVWNELFDFEWTSDSEFNLPSVRVVFENQLTADQSESLGHVELQFPVKDKQTQPFVLRAWLPLRRIRGKYYRKENEETAVHSQKNLKKQPQAPASSLGEVELAIAFVPPVAQTKKHKKALRSSIISVLTTQPQSRKQSQGKAGSSLYSAKKEKLLRAFRQRGAPVSLVPTELALELALNGQDFWSVAPSTCYSVLTPIVVEVEPKFISIAGGSTLYLSGSNFVNTGCLRVAFAVLTKDDTTQTLRSDRTIVVEAKYRSSTSLVCTTPPLLNVATEASYLNVYVSLNGSDFDSIALPKQLVKLSEPASERPLTSVNVDERIEENDDAVMKEPLRKSPRKAPESDSAIALVNEQYVVDCKKVTALALDGCGSGRRSPTRFATRSRNENFLLVPQLRVYLTPKVTRVRPTDGVYTSHLTIDGTSFTNTGVATVT
ncbi:uncharacterized protein PITG_01375 [Phytophthora infestans T30-4]|uniref:C2 domain-containing protein n=1 Tax=Phytophthora infestans (strain T30-4) TaxID=403677 RepID=D0MVD2_PHYIT|nr:uncharacterized protein PITG_01375 [Phytophthora infestans T30-4]EEY61128.1 conserved hypothetical protein [Phytophthora infestans T30-4]|eukprot:XP_002908045.1 conserved hypothetical protein [Phytophthora infestans T30-4]